MQESTYDGYDIAVRAQPRGAGRCLLMADIRKGDAAWATYRDVSQPCDMAAAMAEARAFIDRLAATDRG